MCHGQANDVDDYKSKINDKTKAIFIESIANPGGIITDIEAIASGRGGASLTSNCRQYNGYTISM